MWKSSRQSFHRSTDRPLATITSRCCFFFIAHRSVGFEQNSWHIKLISVQRAFRCISTSSRSLFPYLLFVIAAFSHSNCPSIFCFVFHIFLCFYRHLDFRNDKTQSILYTICIPQTQKTYQREFKNSRMNERSADWESYMECKQQTTTTKLLNDQLAIRIMPNYSSLNIGEHRHFVDFI